MGWTYFWGRCRCGGEVTFPVGTPSLTGVRRLRTHAGPLLAQRSSSVADGAAEVAGGVDGGGRRAALLVAQALACAIRARCMPATELGETVDLGGAGTRLRARACGGDGGTHGILLDELQGLQDLSVR